MTQSINVERLSNSVRHEIASAVLAEVVELELGKSAFIMEMQKIGFSDSYILAAYDVLFVEQSLSDERFSDDKADRNTEKRTEKKKARMQAEACGNDAQDKQCLPAPIKPETEPLKLKKGLVRCSSAPTKKPAISASTLPILPRKVITGTAKSGSELKSRFEARSAAQRRISFPAA
ncbi:hypothetical protein [Escherichia coli]|uniref:hypothetical protein n=1 Tax=Escherichia coli TaxID=562 RepID=UPI000DA5446F|nr:hypothetical protein [Escherichia coli]CAJ1306582.1 hypothetical protein JRT73AECX_JRT73AEC_04924 [Escherichia coli]SQM68806.1 Uncharacterised protein [Escherichia coli]